MLACCVSVLTYFHLQAAFADQHFDADLNFLAIEEDSVTKKVYILFQCGFDVQQRGAFKV